MTRNNEKTSDVARTKLFSVDEKRRPDESLDSDTKKIKTLTGIVSMVVGRGKKPVGFLGGSATVGFLIQWIGEQITQQPEYRWIYFGAGVSVVLLYGAMDYGGVVLRFIQTLGERMDKQTQSLVTIAAELKAGFADGRERFERVEAWQREHVAAYHAKKTPSKSKIQPLAERPKTETAVEPPTIDPLE